MPHGMWYHRYHNNEIIRYLYFLVLSVIIMIIMIQRSLIYTRSINLNFGVRASTTSLVNRAQRLLTTSVMSEKHLATGDPLPPLKNGELHLYSMKYCPYAERARLVLAAKGIHHQTINCNLKKKPEFLLERNPEGKVPVIEKDGKVLYESEIVCNFLNEAYPDPPLYPNDPFQKANDQLLITMFHSKVVMALYKAYRTANNGEGAEEAVAELSKGLARFSQVLQNRGTTFFSGNDNPGMADYLCWPWIERMLIKKQTKALLDTRLNKYVEEMMKIPAIQEVTISAEKHQAFLDSSKGGIPNYDI